MNDADYTKTLDDALNRIAELEAELAAAKEAVFAAVNLAKAFGDEVTELRPWAEVGKRAVWERWYSDEFGFICCQQKDFVHVPDCQITALLAQLEADNE